MVREVEELRPELQLAHATQREVLEERDVPLLLSRVVELVARRVAERAGCRCRVGRRIEPEVLIAAGRELLIRVRLRIADFVVRLAEAAVAYSGDVVRAEHRERRAGAEERGARDLPAAEQVLHERLLP